MLYLNIAFIVIVSIYLFWLYGLIRSLSSDAPFVPIRREILDRMLSMVSPRADALWVDLGSGDGRILIEAARKYGVRGIGVERVTSIRWLSRLRIIRAGLANRIAITGGDFFEAHIADADIVSVYLLPEANRALVQKFKKELRPGTTVVSHRFELPELRVLAMDPDHKIFVAEV